MTDHDAIAAKVRQDRETGTPGPWKIGKNNPARVSREGRYIANFDPLHSNDPKCEDDARRAARLPDLEAAYLDLYDEVKRLRAEKDAKQVKRTIPAGQTPLDDKLNHRFLDVIQEGEAARDAGTASPYHGHSLEHCLHATGWVMRDLRLALDEARARTEKAESERDRLLAALDDIAAAAFWIANDIQIGPDDEGRDIYEMALAIRDDARAALKGDSDE